LQDWLLSIGCGEKHSAISICSLFRWIRRRGRQRSDPDDDKSSDATEIDIGKGHRLLSRHGASASPIITIISGGDMFGKKTVKQKVEKAVQKAVKKATKVEKKVAKKVVKKVTAIKKTVVKKTSSAVKAVKKKITK
jgi:hypothetical protein